MDRLTPEQRSENMRRIRSKDTKPEVLVRSALHRAGYRFTVRGPLNRDLPGKPDLVLPKYRTAVFVHGCFWHLHRDCPEGRTPSSNREYWAPKLATNVARDTERQKALTAAGWKVIIFWECEIEKALCEGELQSFVRDRMRA